MSGSTDVQTSRAMPGNPFAGAGRTHLRLGVAAAAIVAMVLLAVAIVFWLVIVSVPLERTDIWIFREGGRLVRESAPLYDFRFRPGYWTYPPFGAVVMVPLTVLPVDRLLLASWVVNLLALLALVRISFGDVLSRVTATAARTAALLGLTAAALLLVPVSTTLGMGQLGILLTLACLVDVTVLGRGSGRWQGLLVGLFTAIKLTPAVFVPVYWFARRRSAAAVAVGTVLVCWAAAALLRPGDTRAWIERGVLFNTDRQIGGSGRSFSNQSLHGLVDGLPDSLVSPVWLALAVPVLVLGVLWGARALRGGLLLEGAAITGLTSVLISPIAWMHHGVWVIPAIGALVARAGSRRRDVVLGGTVGVLGFALLVPHVDLLTVAYLVLLGLLCLQVRATPAAAVPLAMDGLDSSPERYQREAYHDVMYTGAVGTFSGLVHRIMERPFRGRSSGDVLELGAGAGQHAPYVESFATYLETDIAPRPAQGPPPREGVERRIVDAQDLRQFADASFDRVIATCLLAHLDQPEKALQEWRRVTRPGGTVTVYVPCEPGMLLRLARTTIMVPKARRFSQDHVGTVYREHRNHYPAMRMLVDSTFHDDDVRRSRWPIPFVGWNFALFDVVHATRRD